MLVKDHIICHAGETLTPEQTRLIVSCVCDMCYMLQRVLVVQCFQLSLAIFCITKAMQLVCMQKCFNGLVQYFCTASTVNQIKVNNTYMYKANPGIPAYKPIQRMPSFGVITVSIDTLRRDVENSTNVPIFSIRSWLHETNYCFLLLYQSLCSNLASCSDDPCT